MKPQLAKSIYKDCKDRGYVEHKGKLYPPAQAEKLGLNKPPKKKRTKTVKTGWIDDSRNIKNKSSKKDPFILLVDQNLKEDVWPEFYFSPDRQWRFDYCIPQHMIFIEVEGGVWTGGRHTRPQGFLNDAEKYNSATALGWKMIRVTPPTLLSESTINLIKKTILLK